jgi:hypothetical protein
MSMDDRELESGLHGPPNPTVHQANPSVELSNGFIYNNSGKVQIKHFLANEINTKYVYMLMLVCCLITGFVDGTLYNGKQKPLSPQS